MRGETFETKWFAFNAYGHKNIRAKHKTTLEITKDNYVTYRGDCIIAISSEKSAKDFPAWLINNMRSDTSIIIAVFCTKNACDSVIGFGSRNLILSSENKIIFRKSTYIEPSTVMIRANKAALEIDRKLINDIKNGEKVKIMITALREWDDNLE
ncbi:MAG: DUF371 domain-containing protein [Caldisphaeraceae archaeon]|nr:DUF371 domain-containing protein [Caldisphaeraceae archaeon]